VLNAAAIVLLLLVAALAIPVTLKFQVSWRNALEQNVRAQWAFGLVRVQISPAGTKNKSPSRGDIQRKARSSKRSTGRPRNLLGAITNGKFRRRMMGFVRDLWRAIGKESICVRLRIGLDDPADTGRLWAVLGPLAGVLGLIESASVEIQPEFSEEVFELDSSGTVHVMPLRVLHLLLALALSPTVWRGIRALRT